jgi:hypothetical protein
VLACLNRMPIDNVPLAPWIGAGTNHLPYQSTLIALWGKRCSKMTDHSIPMTARCLILTKVG